MKNNFKRYFFLACTLFALSCTKTVEDQVVIEPPAEDTVAAFNLIITDTPCFKPYQAPDLLSMGTQLSITENIKLDVLVTKKGKWEYSTDTLNGYFFHGEGEFNDTGSNQIVLAAHGTPVSPGNNKFTFKNNNSSIQYEIIVLDHNIQVEPVPVDVSFKGLVGDDEVNVIFPLAGPDNIPYGHAESDTGQFSAFISPGTYPNPPGTGTLSVQREFLFNYYSSTEEDFKNFFTPGAYPIRKYDCWRSGFMLFWQDDQERSWSTFWGTGDQSGSWFKIVGIEDGHDSEGTYFVKVYAKFNCKLYNYDTGEMKQVPNGEMVGYFYRKP